MDDGRQDFDFLIGSWRVRNRRLAVSLQGSDEWREFEATLHARPVLAGLGHLDEYWAPALPDGGSLHGCALRMFDPDARLWRDWWASTSRPGRLDPPAIGRFSDGCGTFLGEDELEQRPIRVRYRWTAVDTATPRWEQAFSPDAGATWEINWTMDLSRPAGG